MNNCCLYASERENQDQSLFQFGDGIKNVSIEKELV